jgi:hypothetical protein
MRANECWIIEDYEYRKCRKPHREFRTAVSLHNHSVHSVENIASLNHVIRMPAMRPFSGILQKAFGLAGIPNLDYADIHYNPPLTPTEVLQLELTSVRRIGFDSLLFALTDHNSVLGGPELLRSPSARKNRIALGEELSILFHGHVFHLGIIGLPPDQFMAVHNQMQAEAQSDSLDNLFDLLHSIGCLVILNHPLLSWHGNGIETAQAVELLERYGWAIHALEYNGMRRRMENDSVLKLARQMHKPVVGGGDSHFLTPGSVLCVSGHADSFAAFIQEVKEGKATPLILGNYGAPLKWKLFLRVLGFIADYRKIAYYKEQDIEKVIGKKRILLDPVGKLARCFLYLAARLKLVR